MPDFDVTLVDPSPAPAYSGMVPGCVSKLYEPSETMIKLVPLAESVGVKYLRAAVVDLVDEDGSSASEFKLSDGNTLSFDVASIDVGSGSRGAELAGAREHAIPTRPISSLVERIQASEAAMKAAGSSPSSVVVVGAGPAGIELALAIRARWDLAFPGAAFNVTLLETGPTLLPGESQECREVLLGALSKRNVTVRRNSRVASVAEGKVILENNETISSSHTLWATGAEPLPIASTLASRGIATDDRGWILVNRFLQSVSHPNIFAAGDCSTISDPAIRACPPKAGVYAVRSGPVLVRNLLKFLNGEELEPYRPQDDFLKLFSLGDGTAIGFRFGLAFEGAWCWALKDYIDRSFMNLFTVSAVCDSSPSCSKLDVKQFDDGLVGCDASRFSPEQALNELRRTDDGVEFRMNWAIIRRMMSDEHFKMEVLAGREGQE